MILLYIFINIIKYHHDCDSDDSNLLPIEEDSIDYQINCSNKKIQNINPKYLSKIKRYTIFNDSNVVFKSNSNNNHYEKLIIYDRPNIKFENDFKFDYLEIHGSPTFSISSKLLIQIDHLLIINQTYEFPYNLFQINENSIEPKSNDIFNQKLSNNEYIHECDYSDCMVSLGIENITYKCTFRGEEIIMKYDEFKNHKFYLLEGVISIYKKEEIDYKLDEIIETISPSIILNGSAVNSVCFFEFDNSTQIANYKNAFNREIELWLYNPNWSEIHVDKYWWKVATDDIVYTTNIYYHYCNDTEVQEDVEIIVIPKKTLTYIIIGSVSFIFFLFFSLLIIAFCVHRFCYHKNVYRDSSSLE